MSREAEPAVAAAMPDLQQGDRLTRPEFERRYLVVPHCTKAELIEGAVHLPWQRVPHPSHAGPQFQLVGWLGAYHFATYGSDGGDSATICLDWENEARPDAFLRILPRCGGQS
jgi:hypothetical protein